ncbi:hypothetical protein [Streptomyces sp. NPDC056987]|uniref:hypothetical protein n=1 Tax=Streptomyces sp. NPDC056987 TaxID=3345988 RepID=UPI00363480C1
MNVVHRPAASLATEAFDAETQTLLNAIDVELPGFGDVDLDVAFGTPLDMHEAGLLPHEQVTGEMGREEFLDALIAADSARRARMQAARDIVAADPAVTELVRERLVDVLLPYAAQLRPVPVVVERIEGRACGTDAWYTARRDAEGFPADSVIDQVFVTVTKRGHWYRSDDVRNGNNDSVCRGCPAAGHFDYILNGQGFCPRPATADDIRAALCVPSTVRVDMRAVPASLAA